MQNKFFDFDTFDVEEYEHYEVCLTSFGVYIFVCI